ncbi:GNAT family N-acetyltransferase [Metabacillus litoralis]|uniref:GNAT family N-acetyltransferase n=1 Tax=Metabacillus litoralis TaxID=152268 RepID=UPI001CFCF838|nr:GNAT family N-acetyltransferase [Metabacillus litoralis]
MSSDSTPYNLLLEADPSINKVNRHLSKGKCFVSIYSSEIVGIIIINEKNTHENEIVNLAVLEKFRGKGIAKKLIKYAVDYSRNKGKKSIFVGTGNSSLNQLALYQKCGFRLDHIIINYFIENYDHDIIENGITCVDLVMLKKSIINIKGI